MANCALLAACLIAGIVLRRSGRVPDNAHLALNAVIVNLSLPALTLAVLDRATPTLSLAFAVAMPWLVFALALVAFVAVGRRLGLAPATAGALLLTAGLGNTSFLGLPMIETFYGADRMSIGILIDQLGSYLVLSLVGIPFAAALAAERCRWDDVARRVLAFPPFLAVLVAVAVAASGLAYPRWLDLALERLGATVAPLALLSVGMQLRFEALREERVPLALGLSFKLLAAPLALWLACAALGGTGDVVIRVALLEAAMAPMLGGGIVAMQYRLNPPLVALLLGLGIPLSFLSVPLWWAVLEHA